MSAVTFVFVLALIHLIGAAWLLGGYYSLSRWVMGISGWCAFGVSTFFLYADLRHRKANPALNKIWLLWASLIVFLVISLLNPSYSEIITEEGFCFVYNAPVTWLPAVVSQSRSTPMIFQLTGTLVLVWSVLAVFRTRDWHRKLLFVCVFNAALLAFVGAFFKLLGAENPLGFFRAVHPGFFASFSYHNHWVAFASLALFTVTGLFVHRLKNPQHNQTDANQLFLLGAFGFFLLLSLLLVGSRTGLLVLGIYLACFSFRFIFFRNRVGKAFSGVTILVIVGILAVGYLSVLISEKQIDYTAKKYEKAWYAFWDSDKDVDSFRFKNGPKIAVDIIKDKPMLGWGWGSYKYAMARYAPKYIGQNVIAQYAHCDWLQFLGDLGVIGFSLFVAPIIYLICKYRKPDIVAIWICLGLSVILFIALFEFPLSNPAVLSHFMVGLIASIGLRSVNCG